MFVIRSSQASSSLSENNPEEKSLKSAQKTERENPENFVPYRYCPARWIRLKVVSFERSLLNGEARRFFSEFCRMGDGQIFSKNLRASLFNDDLSNEP